MSNVQIFLSALKNDFSDLFVVKEGAPIDEFWESYNLAVSEAVEHNVQRTACHVCESIEFYGNGNVEYCSQCHTRRR